MKENSYLENYELMDRLKKVVTDRISEYVGTDINLILSAADSAYVFGGAVRDSLAGMEIHDVDLIVAPKSTKRIEEVLRELGFKRDDKLTSLDVAAMYDFPNRKINEPITYTRVVDGRIAKLQLIRPVVPFYRDGPTVVRKAMRNVDISCCAVSLSFHHLEEHLPGAIRECKNKVFRINEKGFMVTDRLTARRYKLTQRGWRDLNSEILAR